MTNSQPEANEPRRSPSAPAPHDGGSLLIASLAGIPIRIHVTFLLLLGFLGFEYFGSKSRSWSAILLIVGLFVCVVLHELAHAAVAKRYGVKTLSITLYPIGGVAVLEQQPQPRDELWIALAGPFANLVIAGGLWVYLRLTHRLDPPTLFIEPARGFVSNLMTTNLLLAGFNMLPAFPMDGGRVLRSVIARFTDATTATTAAARIGQGMAILIGIYGIATGQFITMIIAGFIWFGAGQEASYFQTRALLVGHRVREAMLREFHTLTVGSTLREAADLLIVGSQQDFPILSGSEVVGVLSRSALLQAMANQGPETYVAGVMDREFATSLPDDPLDSLLARRAAGPILVFKDAALTDASLIGMVTQENLLEFLTLTQLAMRSRPPA